MVCSRNISVYAQKKRKKEKKKETWLDMKVIAEDRPNINISEYEKR